LHLRWIKDLILVKCSSSVKLVVNLADFTADLLPSQMKAGEALTDKEKEYLKILDITQP